MIQLEDKKLAFFCSKSCPGDIILKAQDWANARNGDSIAVIGGFHTPVEKEVLRILIRNAAPVIYVLSTNMERWKKSLAIAKAMKNGSLIAISPFKKKTPANERSAALRNDYIISQTNEILIAHASQSGKTEALAQSAITQDKKLFTFPSPSNTNLLQLGATKLNDS